VLVGGFAASDWLFTKLCELLTPLDVNMVRPENHVNKAVSDGAISFYLDHIVRTRVSKFTYGSFIHVAYDPSNPDHQYRSHRVFISASGARRLLGSFSIILPKNTQVSETKEFRRSYYSAAESAAGLRTVSFPVWCYRGNVAVPRWEDVDATNYTKLCTIEADLSGVPLLPQPKAVGQGTYYSVDYDFVLLLGMTELKAQIAWRENGVEKRSPTKIVYDPDIDRDPEATQEDIAPLTSSETLLVNALTNLLRDSAY